MNRTARWTCFLLSLGPLCVAALGQNSSSAPVLRIDRDAGNRVRVSFSSLAGKKYQPFASQDLRTWSSLGAPLAGTGQVVTFGFDSGAQEAGFFRVDVRSNLAPVPVTIQSISRSNVEIGFPTVRGKQYLIYGTFDFKQWFTMGSLVQGSGQRIQLLYETRPDEELFFRGQEMEISPLTNMVWIPSGVFIMGSPITELNRDLDEDPLTEVFLSHGFWMGKHEATQQEYESVMGNNPSWFRGSLNLPVEFVAWKEAVAYCVRLTERERALGRLPEGFAYRLPTEAEFEYACRAGASTRFYYGEDPDFQQLGEYAWYDKNSSKKTQPVGQKKPNAFGLHDMHGNVWEWCLDWYENRYPGGSVTDPKGPPSGTSRVFRGGGWDYIGAACRAAFRNNVTPARQLNYVGFRPVLAPEL